MKSVSPKGNAETLIVGTGEKDIPEEPGLA
jgi:hypothetical protein